MEHSGRKLRAWRRIRTVHVLAFLAGAGLAVGCIALALGIIAVRAPGTVQVRVPAAVVNNQWPFPANSHPDTLPVAERVQHWVHVDTPPGYPSVMRACLGTDGVYVDQYGAMASVPHDPECATADPPKK